MDKQAHSETPPTRDSGNMQKGVSNTMIKTLGGIAVALVLGALAAKALNVRVPEPVPGASDDQGGVRVMDDVACSPTPDDSPQQ